MANEQPTLWRRGRRSVSLRSATRLFRRRRCGVAFAFGNFRDPPGYRPTSMSSELTRPTRGSIDSSTVFQESLLRACAAPTLSFLGEIPSCQSDSPRSVGHPLTRVASFREFHHGMTDSCHDAYDQSWKLHFGKVRNTYIHAASFELEGDEKR